MDPKTKPYSILNKIFHYCLGRSWNLLEKSLEPHFVPNWPIKGNIHWIPYLAIFNYLLAYLH
jgi:hypothetical protein